jgi:hypothetical protein
MYLPHAVVTVNILKTSDHLNVVDKRYLNKNVKLFPHMNVVMTLHSLVMTKQDKKFDDLHNTLTHWHTQPAVRQPGSLGRLIHSWL